MYQIRKRFTFEAAHQLEDAYTKACSDCIHGHSYTVEMVLASKELNHNGMVLDFGELKKFKQQVMENWDHGLILHENKKQFYQPLIGAGLLKSSKVTFLPENPTAEVMAGILFSALESYVAKIDEGVVVVAVRIHETSTGWAEYRG